MLLNYSLLQHHNILDLVGNHLFPHFCIYSHRSRSFVHTLSHTICTVHTHTLKHPFAVPPATAASLFTLELNFTCKTIYSCTCRCDFLGFINISLSLTHSLTLSFIQFLPTIFLQRQPKSNLIFKAEHGCNHRWKCTSSKLTRPCEYFVRKAQFTPLSHSQSEHLQCIQKAISMKHTELVEMVKSLPNEKFK